MGSGAMGAAGMDEGISQSAIARGDEKRPGDARLRLILAAERYFALHGFGGTSLKDIHEAAGQRNASAIHYYFNSRDGLIEAVLDHRVLPRVETRRAVLLELAGHATRPALREIVAIWIEQLANELRPRQEGNYSLRFLDELRRTGPAGPRAKAADMQVGYGRIFELIEEHLPSISPSIRRSRLAISAELIISGLAQLEGRLPTTGGSSADYPALAIASLIDFVTAGLAIRPGPETLAIQSCTTSTVDFQFNFSTIY